MYNHGEALRYFSQVEFRKTGADLKTAAERKITALDAKVLERETRITNLRKQYDITDADLVELLRLMSAHAGAQTYSVSNHLPASGPGVVNEKVIPAGVVNNLNTEAEFIDAERAESRRLKLMVRNLDPTTTIKLSFAELEYLGF